MKPSCATGTRLYDIWRGMKRRCENPKCKDYPDYGGRGVKVCETWSMSFPAFADWAWENGYTTDRSLDRVDVNSGYCPENCRWASYLEQQVNRRESAETYANVRLKATRMRSLLAHIPDDAVVTLVVRRDALNDRETKEYTERQDRDAPIPVTQRIDKNRNKRNNAPLKHAPKFVE